MPNTIVINDGGEITVRELNDEEKAMNAEMAEAFGINTSRMYALTFGLGSAFAGIAGGMFALTATISPFFGINYTLLAFITVVVGGGANVISGILTSAAALAGTQTILNNTWSVYIGYVSMMVAAFLFLLVSLTYSLLLYH